ncbi:hypothetical protein GCM10023317_57790 [Actinopolymorpha pittospori]
MRPAQVFDDEDGKAAGFVEPGEDTRDEPFGNVLECEVLGAEPALSLFVGGGLDEDAAAVSQRDRVTGGRRQSRIGFDPLSHRLAEGAFETLAKRGRRGRPHTVRD